MAKGISARKEGRKEASKQASRGCYTFSGSKRDLGVGAFCERKEGRKEGNKWVEKMRKVVPAPAAVHSIACMHKRREAVRIGIGYGNGKWEMKASKGIITNELAMQYHSHSSHLDCV